MRRLLIGLLMLAILPYSAAADDVVKLVTYPRLRAGAVNSYDLALLHEALERTRRDYGAYEVQSFTEDVSFGRAIELATEGRLVNVLSAGVGQTAPSPERDISRSRSPLTRGCSATAWLSSTGTAKTGSRASMASRTCASYVSARGADG